jgi:seryl-tRNA synthetase
MSRGLVPFTVPNERSAIRPAIWVATRIPSVPWQSMGQEVFLLYAGRCHTGICRQALRRHLRTGVIQVSSGRRYAGICGQVLRQYLQAGVTQAYATGVAPVSSGRRYAGICRQSLCKCLHAGVAQVFAARRCAGIAGNEHEIERYQTGGRHMIDIRLVRTEPELVKENMRKKFQHEKLGLVDEVLELDRQYRETKTRCDELRSQRNSISKGIGALMAKGQREEAEKNKAKVVEINNELEELAKLEEKLDNEIRERMMKIPNIIDDSVPIGRDDSENVETERYGDPKVPGFEIPYHVDIMERLCGIDLDSARKTSGNGFYYLCGDIARLHSAILTYARDFMIDRGFTYYIPPFMIRGEVVTGVMSFTEMENMMYKIEGEDLYLIGTSEHSMIGKFIDTILDEDQLPQALTSYSPCFRKEVGAHGIEERGVYRIHQFEKQEMIVVCKPEDSPEWFRKLYMNTVDFFRSLDIPVRVLECCSGDLADLKVKSVDVEAWSPRQQKYFEVGSCSNLGDAQARRLRIRVRDKEKGNYHPHTLNNTVVAPPRMLIAFLENNLNEDGTVRIPEPLQAYMGGKKLIG